MLPNREGRFLAVIQDVGISETGNPPKCTVAITFNLTQERRGDAWASVENEAMSISGYFYLETNSGGLNEFTVKTFREALAWDGRNIEHLTTVAGAEVQLTLAFEEYQGKSRIKVKYLNSATWEGGAVAHDADAMKRAQSRLGSKLRALPGGTPAPAVKPKVAAPPTAARVAPPPPTTNPKADSGFPWENRESTVDDCWARLCEMYPTIPAEKQGAAWTALIADVLPGVTDTSVVTSSQWGQVMNELERPGFRAAV